MADKSWEKVDMNKLLLVGVGAVAGIFVYKMITDRAASKVLMPTPGRNPAGKTMAKVSPDGTVRGAVKRPRSALSTEKKGDVRIRETPFPLLKSGSGLVNVADGVSPSLEEWLLQMQGEDPLVRGVNEIGDIKPLTNTDGFEIQL